MKKEKKKEKEGKEKGGTKKWKKDEKPIVTPWGVAGCKECGGSGLYMTNQILADYYCIKRGKTGIDFWRICRTCINKKNSKTKQTKKRRKDGKDLHESTFWN
ncbi:MAG: hypothetical protein LBU10_01170 [Endomicrobium sp.]|jgi:hypothetical protein|nr:hypothetical protein [Endomicrobium sp.]